MTKRPDNLQHFINKLEVAVHAGLRDLPEAQEMADRLFQALETTGNENQENNAARLPACRHFSAACDAAQTGPEPIPDLTQALAAIEPSFAWTRRRGITNTGDDFYDGHANTVIIGQGGLEERHDLMVGLSLVAPGITYPRHRHPPEEIYVVLSPGEWVQGDQAFSTKHSGNMIHHKKNVWHAMQAANVPLLAIWCLWLEA